MGRLARLICAVLALLLGLISPVHAAPPQVAPPAEAQLPVAPDHQPPPVIVVYLVAYRAHGPPSGAFLLCFPQGDPVSAGCILYAYCGGDPINFSDPSGLDRVWAGDGLGLYSPGHLRQYAMGTVSYAMTKGNWLWRSTVGTASIGKIAAGGGEPIDQRIEVEAKYGGGTINYALFQEVAAEEDRGNSAGAGVIDSVIKGVVDEVKRREGQGRGPAPNLDERAGIIIAQSRADGDSFPLAMYKGLGYTAWYMLPVVPNADIAWNGQVEAFTHKNLVGMGEVDGPHRVSAGLFAFSDALLLGAGGRSPGASSTPGFVGAEMAWGARLEATGNNVFRLRTVQPAPTAPRAYSNVFEMQLRTTDLGRSRSVHFNRANAALDEAMVADPAFAAMVEELIPNAGQAVSRVGGREVPFGWTWQHALRSQAQGRTGVMQLVPTDQHTPGSLYWRLLHPDAGGAGGYAEWAIPAGAPPN